MHLNYEVVVFTLVAIFWVIRGIFRFFKWVGRQFTGGAAGANPARQALADAQRQLQAPPSQAPSPAQTLPTRAPTLAPPRPLPRQPQAGGPVVPREATDADFRRQERELMTEEPTALGGRLQSPTPITAAPMKTLFGDTDDLVRAFILREALGPPLSRRSPGAPPPLLLP